MSPPIIARYIKVHPKTWNSFISLRVELYGCREGKYILKRPIHLGKENWFKGVLEAAALK